MQGFKLTNVEWWIELICLWISICTSVDERKDALVHNNILEGRMFVSEGIRMKAVRVRSDGLCRTWTGWLAFSRWVREDWRIFHCFRLPISPPISLRREEATQADRRWKLSSTRSSSSSCLVRPKVESGFNHVPELSRVPGKTLLPNQVHLTFAIEANEHLQASVLDDPNDRTRMFHVGISVPSSHSVMHRESIESEMPGSG